MSEATAGFNTQLKLAGAAISMTEESMSDTGNGTLWQIDAIAKEIFNPVTTFTVEVNSGGGFSTISASNYNLNYLNGEVDFNNDQTGNSVRISGEYLPTYTIAKARSVSYSRSYEDLDVTTFEQQAIDRILGLQDVEVTVTNLDIDDDPLDGQGGSEDKLSDLFVDDTITVVEYIPEGLVNVTSGARQGRIHRAFVKLTESELDSSPDGIFERNITFVADHQDAAMSSQEVELFNSRK